MDTITTEKPKAGANPAALLHELEQFTGTSQWYRFNLNPRHLLTDGTHYLAEATGAFWLMDLIASWQIHPSVRAESFQQWSVLLSDTAKGALITADDGNGKIIASQHVPFTDFPLGLGHAFKLWAERNELGGMTILLPSEH